MRARLHLLAALAVVAACGSRTGLLVGEEGPGPVSFEAGASGPLWLLFDLTDGSGASPTSGIYAMRADGTKGHWMTLPHGPGFFPRVTADGSQLLYAAAAPAGSNGDSAVYLYDFARGTDRFIVATSGLTYSALSPDGRTVAYVSSESLRAVNADGTNDRVLIGGPNGCGTGYGHPAFGTDSSTVVYVTGGLVGTIGIDGSNQRTLLTDDVSCSGQYPNPAFSPDFSEIVVGISCGTYALRVYPWASLSGASCPGTGLTLTSVTGGESPNGANDPSWGVNGLIAYASGPDVFVIPEGGGAPRNMSAGLRADDAGRVVASDPVWAPADAPIP